MHCISIIKALLCNADASVWRVDRSHRLHRVLIEKHKPNFAPESVSIWCRACRFAHTQTVRMDSTLVRLFGWTKAAGHKAIMRLFGRFDMLTNERVQAETYRWFFGKIGALKRVTLDVDSTVITRNGEHEDARRGYHPNRHGRASHHPLLAFVAEARVVANFWLRPGNVHSANNILQFLESTLHHLDDKSVGLLRADSGFFDETSWRPSKTSAFPI